MQFHQIDKKKMGLFSQRNPPDINRNRLFRKYLEPMKNRFRKGGAPHGGPPLITNQK